MSFLTIPMDPECSIPTQCWAGGQGLSSQLFPTDNQRAPSPPLHCKEEASATALGLRGPFGSTTDPPSPS